MSHAAPMTAPRSRWRNVAWAPAVLLVAWGLLAANGYRVLGSAHAATGNTTVTATVTPEVHVTSCATFAVGTIAPTSALFEGSADCGVVFGSNNDTAGTVLTVKNALSLPTTSSPFFCWDTDSDPANGGRTCAAGKQFTDHGTANSALAANEFGGRINSTSGAMCSAGTWSSGATNFNGVPTNASAATTVENTTAVGDCTVNLRFGAKADNTMNANTGATNYTGQALFTATAN